jgi:hypothetical protein
MKKVTIITNYYHFAIIIDTNTMIVAEIAASTVSQYHFQPGSVLFPCLLIFSTKKCFLIATVFPL